MAIQLHDLRSERIKARIRRNAELIRQLHDQIQRTSGERDRSRAQRERWLAACADFDRRYDQLAFPGGLRQACLRMADGDAATIEAALCFVEVRPWFFRSGFIYRRMLRKLRRAELSPGQQRRFAAFDTPRAGWKSAGALRAGERV